MVAIKVMRPFQVNHAVKSKVLKKLKREIVVWQALEHDNIVPFLGVSYSFGSLPALISVWMDNGQLNVYLSTHPNVDRSRIAEGLANGLLYLHARVPQITHGDIKAANALVDREGNPRLCDFGLSRLMSEDDLWMTTTVNSQGSVRWMAPELLDGTQVLPTPESDVYAFAMTILEMLTGRIPFHHHRSDAVVTMAIIIQKEIPSRPTEIIGSDLWQVDFDELWACLTTCWDPEPGRRPSVAVVGELFRTGSESRMPIAIVIPAFKSIPSEPLRGHQHIVTSVAFSPDGKWIASGSNDKTVRVWNAETGQALYAPLQGHQNGVSSVAISPDGKRIASGSIDMTVRVWNAETGEALFAPLKRHTSWVSSIAFSPNGKRIALGSCDMTLRVWDAETGKVASGSFEGRVGFVSSVAFSPDGRWIASGSDDCVVQVWNAETGKMASKPFRGHTGSVTSVAFSPDGQRIASGSYDKTVRLWHAKTGQALFAPFEGHANWVSSVAFSPDGKRIASGSNDMTVRVWDAETIEPLYSLLEGHTNAVTSVAFSPDGKRIASGSYDHTIRVWNAETGEQTADTS